MLLSGLDSTEHPAVFFVTGRLQPKLGLPVWGTGTTMPRSLWPRWEGDLSLVL